MMRYYCLWAFILTAGLGWGQSTLPCDSLNLWAPREGRWWGDFSKQIREWPLSDASKSTMQAAVCDAARQQQVVSIRMSNAEEVWNESPGLADTLLGLRKLQEEITAHRNVLILSATPLEFWPLMDELLHPPKPKVLHFGIHDRMNCDVCIPQE